MREPLIPRSDWLADSLNALFLRRVWRPAAGALPEPDAVEAAVEDRPDVMAHASGVCEECGNTSTGRYCGICSDPTRERATIMVVSNSATILQAEARGYRDVYHVHSPGAGGVDQVPFSVSSFRLQDHLRRYRATKVILKLDSEAEEEDQQRRLQEELEGLGYSVSLSQAEASEDTGAVANDRVESVREGYAGADPLAHSAMSATPLWIVVQVRFCGSMLHFT